MIRTFFNVFCLFLLVQYCSASKLGAIVNPDNCSACNSQVYYLQHVNSDTIDFIYSENYTRKEVAVFLEENADFLVHKTVNIKFSDEYIKAVRVKLKVPENIQSLVFLYNSREEPKIFFGFNELSMGVVSLLNDHLISTSKVSKKKIEGKDFAGLGSFKMLMMSDYIVVQSYAQNKVFIVDTQWQLTNVFLPENLPLLDIYKTYNQGDTTGFDWNYKFFTKRVLQKKNDYFQFNSINRHSDTSFNVMGSLYVAKSSSYLGNPSIAINQELILLEFSNNVLINISYIKTKDNYQICKNFYPDYTFYQESINGDGVDVAVERDTRFGSKKFLAKLKYDGQHNLSFNKLYNRKLPKTIRNSKEPYSIYSFFRVEDAIFFSKSYKSFVVYNSVKDEFSEREISNYPKNLIRQIRDSCYLSCARKTLYGYELIFINDTQKSYVKVMVSNEVEYITSHTRQLEYVVRSNIVYSPQLEGYCYKTTDNDVAVIR
jgi:hypothetical protein